MRYCFGRENLIHDVDHAWCNGTFAPFWHVDHILDVLIVAFVKVGHEVTHITGRKLGWMVIILLIAAAAVKEVRRDLSRPNKKRQRYVTVIERSDKKV